MRQWLYIITQCQADLWHFYGWPWLAVYINFVQNIHQIQVVTEPLCRAQAIFNALRINERGTKYRGLTYSVKQTVCEICRATYSASQTHLRIYLTVSITVVQSIETPKTTPKHPKPPQTSTKPKSLRYILAISYNVQFFFRTLMAFSGGGGVLGPVLALCKNTYRDRAKRPPAFWKANTCIQCHSFWLPHVTKMAATPIYGNTKYVLL